MYITCPNCHTKFIVTNDQIGINGRHVKCSKCSHPWYQKLDYTNSKLSNFSETETNFEAIKVPLKHRHDDINNNNVPVILPYTPSQNKNYNIFPLLWTSFIIFSLLILLIDSFKFLGKYDQLKIEDISLIKSYNADAIKIFYKLSNHSDYLISNPLIKFKVVDNNNQILEQYMSIIKLKAKIPTKQNVYVEMEIKGLPLTAKYIDITVGNKLGFLLE